jgi:hypothetical protein
MIFGFACGQGDRAGFRAAKTALALAHGKLHVFEGICRFSAPARNSLLRAKNSLHIAHSLLGAK